MTGKRLEVLEQRARAEEQAYLESLSDEALHPWYVDVLRRAGHADPEGEAGRMREAVAAMTDEELRAALAKSNFDGSPSVRKILKIQLKAYID